MKVYHVTTLSLNDFGTYASLESAQKKLKKLADERRNCMGVRCFEQEENSFSYLMGWEETRVRFYIKEINVED